LKEKGNRPLDLFQTFLFYVFKVFYIIVEMLSINCVPAVIPTVASNLLVFIKNSGIIFLNKKFSASKYFNTEIILWKKI
jgi:hypothetical protein